MALITTAKRLIDSIQRRAKRGKSRQYAARSARRLRFRKPWAEQLEERALLSIGGLGDAFLSAASPFSEDRLWQAVEQAPDEAFAGQAFAQLANRDVFTLDRGLLASTLAAAPLEFTAAAQTPLTVNVPTPEGTFSLFTVVESPIMAPELAAKFPEISTYSGQGIDDPTATLRFDVTPSGMHGQVLSPNGGYYFEPLPQLGSDRYWSAYIADMVTDLGVEGCDVLGDIGYGQDLLVDQGLAPSAIIAAPLAAPSGTELRTYRMAVGATGEFTAAAGGSVSSSLAEIVGIVNWVNGIYESELAIRFQLVANTDLLIYINAATDGYSNDNSSAILGENQIKMDAIITPAAYDIGHVFSTAGGGLASVGSAGRDGLKARGVSGNTTRFTTAHEIGHQFSARHTWNGDDYSSSSWDAAAAMEPGSGTTIMSYGHVGDNDNLQGYRDPYFHSFSAEQIVGHADGTIAGVGTRTATGNTLPTVSAGLDYTIPTGTPFLLTATGSDADGDMLTYSWEQHDAGSQRDIDAPDDGLSPLFRVWNPTVDSTRMFPRLSDLLNDTTAKGERLPSVARSMDFRVTARDNRAGGGGIRDDDMVVTVVDTGSSFQVTNPNTAVTWTGATSQAITWNVAGTDGAGIDTANVNIRLSTDGGQTFPHLLATTANDGSHPLTLPNINTTQARLKIEGDGNIFFDLSDATFTITSNPAAAGVILTPAGDAARPAEGRGDDTYNIALTTDPVGVVSLTATADDQTRISVDGVNFASSQPLTFDSTASQTITVRALDDSIEEGPHVSVITHDVTASTSAAYPMGMLLDNLVAHVLDDEIPPMVGVDIDDITGGSATSPENWTTFQIMNSFDAQTISNLPRDDGTASPFDLEFLYDNAGYSAGSWTGATDAATKPRHFPSLDEINGYTYSTNSITATWSDLSPDRDYGVYVFGLESDSSLAFKQTITITGANSTSFTQTLTDDVLYVNDEVGTNSRALHSYEEVITPTASGEIEIRVVPDSGFWGFALGGMAIREIPEAINTPPALDPIPDPTAIDENASLQTINLTGISDGDGGVQALQVTATSDNTALIPDPSVSYTSPDATGSLTYTPAADQSGTALITVTVTDAGLDGTLGTGDDGTVQQTFTVTVTAAVLNAAPILDATQAPALPAIDENETDPAGDTVASIIVDGSITDADLGSLSYQEGDTSSGGVNYSTDAVTIRQWTGSNYDGTQNENHRDVIIVGFNEPMDLVTRELLRGLVEFDLTDIAAAAGSAPILLESVSLVFRTAATAGKQEGSGYNDPFTLDVYNYPYDVDETTATWANPASGDSTPGGSPGALLSSSPVFDVHNTGVTVTIPDSAAFRDAVADALAGDKILRLLLRAPDVVENEPQTSGPIYDGHFTYLDAESAGVESNRPKLLITAATPEAIAVVDVDNTNGTWQFSSDGSAWTDFVAPTVAAAPLLRPEDYVRFVPNANFFGDSSLEFRAWDPRDIDGGFVVGTPIDTTVNGGASNFSLATDTVSITVNEVNLPPVLNAIGAQSVDELTQLTFTASATDPDVPDDTLVFSLGANAPTAAAIDASSGVFTWTPTEADGPGSFTFDVIVTDDGDPWLTDSESITVTVLDVVPEFIVNRFDDLVDQTPLGDGRVDVDLITPGDQITLRAAIQEANALEGDDTITLPAGDYALSIAGTHENEAATGDLDITDLTGSLTITGAGPATTTINAAQIDRVLHIPTGAALNLSGITITGGDPGGYNSGGGIYSSDGTLTVTDSIITGNSAKFGGGVINFYGELTVTNSTISGNTADSSGGAMHNQAGTLTVTNSIISDNSAGSYGGGVNNYEGTLTVTNSTISRNTADSSGGALYNQAGTLTVTNSTLSVNAANYGGAIETSQGSVTVTNSTIVGNSAVYGAGIDNYWSTALTMNNSIFFLNTDCTRGDIASQLTPQSGFNLIGVDPGFVRNPAPGVDGVWGTPDDDLGDLRLTSQSPAIGMGSNAVLPPDTQDLDGNGNTTEPTPLDLDLQSRVYGGRVDIGAYEFQGDPIGTRETPSAVVTTLDDTVDLYDGLVSLREAVFYRSAEEITEPILFDPTLDGGRIVLGGDPLSLDRPVRIDASALGSLIVDAGDKSRVMTVLADGVELVGLTITGGVADIGGGICNYATLSVIDSTISGNSADGEGGGINNYTGTLSVINSTVSGNWAGWSGGGIQNDYYGGTLTVSGSVISGNSADRAGGGIYNNWGDADVTNTTISDNVSEDGGGLYNFTDGTMNVTNSTISGNSATMAFGGGGIYNQEGTLNVTYTTISSNSADDGEGGGVYNSIYGTTNLTNSTLLCNSAGYSGGAVYSDEGTVSIANSTISGNTATWGGGAISADFHATLNLTNSIVFLNPSPGYEEIDAELGPLSGFNLIGIDPGFVRNPAPGVDGVWGTVDDDLGDLCLTSQSPAVGMGNNALLPLDTEDMDGDGNTTEPIPLDFDFQPRVYGANVDMGAYEYQGDPTGTREAPSAVVNTLGDTVDLYDGLISLREALFYLNVEEITGPILFDPSLDGGRILLAGIPLTMERTVRIDASALESLTIDAGDQSRVMTVLADDVELTALTITGGWAESGGGIRNFSDSLRVVDSTISGNSAGVGGGIFNEGNTAMTVIGSTISGNSAAKGGGVYNFNHATLNVIDSSISNNSADNGGGICNLADGTVILTNSTISGNLASVNGGGIYTRYYGGGSTLIATNSTIAGNVAVEKGGGLFNEAGSATLDNTILALNVALIEGSDISGLSVVGSNNLIGVDPMFMRNPSPGADGTWGTSDDDVGDLRLQPGGPAVDAGDNSLLPPDIHDLDGDGDLAEPIPFDLDGKTRVTNGIVDIGAYEYAPIPPAVVGVYFRGSGWRSTFLDELDAQGHGHATIPRLGFANPVGDGSQLDVMPWSNVNQISVVFDQETIVEADDLTVLGVNTSTYALDDSAFSYDPATFTATWSLVTPLSADKLLLLLDSDSTSGVRSPSGVAMDGEWTNSADTFPSGDGTAGGDFAFRANMHPGNVNGDERVTFSDFFTIRARLGQSPGTSGYDVIHDLNGDARITFSDAFLSRAQLGVRLPAGDPGLPPAPTAFDMALLSWVELDSSDEDDSDILTQTIADDLALVLTE